MSSRPTWAIERVVVSKNCNIYFQNDIVDNPHILVISLIKWLNNSDRKK